MSRWMACLVLVHVLTGATQTYTLREDSLPTRENDISAKAAFDRFLVGSRILWGEEPSGEFQASLNKGRSRPREWEFISEDTSVTVSAATGKVVAAREADPKTTSRRSRLNRTKPAIATVDQATAKARSLAVLLGYTAEAQISECRLDAMGQQAPQASVFWTPFHKGRRVLGPGAHMSFDCLDGTLCFYYYRLDTTIETEEPVLTVDDAVVRATDYYGRVLPQGFEPYGYSDLDKPQCVYRVATGEPVGPSRPQDADNYLVRCCWEVHFGKDKVWVDAVNGDCLGYYFFQRKSG